MRLRGHRGRLRLAAQNLRNGSVSSKALILVYHQSTEVPSRHPQLLCVSPGAFRRASGGAPEETYRPIRLRHLAQTIGN